MEARVNKVRKFLDNISKLTSTNESSENNIFTQPVQRVAHQKIDSEVCDSHAHYLSFELTGFFRKYVESQLMVILVAW
jgi:hypothetical protein